jgi:hypothetical protein
MLPTVRPKKGVRETPGNLALERASKHALETEWLRISTNAVNGSSRMDWAAEAQVLMWSPYDGVQGIAALSNGRFVEQPDWYRNFEYMEERARGLDSVEDLASRGWFQWDG